MTLNDHTEAEVNQFDHPCAFLNENIVQLDVSMNDIEGVQIGNRLSNLFKNTTRSGFSNDPICQWLWILLQGDAFDEVSHDVYLLRGVYQVMKLDNARVLKSF